MKRNHQDVLVLYVGFLVFVVVTVTGPHAARAASYAFSSDIVFFSFTGGTIFGAVGSTMTNTAEFRGFGRDSTTDRRDAQQAKSGPGPFPEENQVVLEQGRVGQYARADSLIQGLGETTPGDMRNVAEVFRSSVGTAEANATVQQGFGLRQTTDDPINFRFAGFPTMKVEADGPQDSASASIIVSLALRDADSLREVFRWTPRADPQNPASSFRIDGGVVTNLVEPYSLNTSIFCRSGPCVDSYDPTGGGGVFTISYKRAPGQSYLADLLLSESAFVSVIPEPSTLTLVLVGLMVAAVGTQVRRPGARVR